MKNKKAFTIVELVIVIAVIAILAAVLIPTFSNIIKKAQTSSDTQLIRNLNDALAIDLAEKEEDKHATCYDAMQAVEEAGYNVARIVAKSGYNIAWDLETGHFVLLNEQKDHVLYPVNVNTNEEYDITDEQDKANLFVVRYNVSGDDYVAPEHYSLYAGLTFNAKNITLNGVGFDAGYQEGIEKVTYVNTGSEKDIVIRTNSFLTTISINGPLDSVKHYGYAASIDVISIKPSSLDEYGIVGRVEVQDGHVEAMDGCEIFCLMEEGASVISTTVNTGAIVHPNMVNINAEAGVEKNATTGVANGHVDDCGPGRHTFSQYVVDTEHVYDVCTCCGYTLIHVMDESGTEIKQTKNILDSNGDVTEENVSPVETYLTTTSIPKKIVDGVTSVDLEALLEETSNKNLDIDGNNGKPVEETPVVVNKDENGKDIVIEKKCAHEFIYSDFLHDTDDICLGTCKYCSLKIHTKHDWWVTTQLPGQTAYESTCTKCGCIREELVVQVVDKDGNPINFGTYKDGGDVAEGKYETMPAALAAIHDASKNATANNKFKATITLLKKESVNVYDYAMTIYDREDITLELNGQVLAGYASQETGNAVFLNNGILTIKDNNDIRKDGTGSGRITYVAPNEDLHAVPMYSCNVIRNCGTLNINSGYIYNKSAFGSASFAIDSTTCDSTTNITGGRVEAVRAESIRLWPNGCHMTCNISNAVLKSFWVMDYSGDQVDLNIQDTLILNKLTLGYITGIKNSNITINNCTIGQTNWAFAPELYNNVLTFTNNKVGIMSQDDYAGDINIDNGYYNSDVSLFTKDGYSCVENLDANKNEYSYKICKNDCIPANTPIEAKIGDTEYYSFIKAISEVATGQTIVLQKDINISGDSVVLDVYNTIIDLNGHTINISTSKGFYLESENYAYATFKNGTINSKYECFELYYAYLSLENINIVSTEDNAIYIKTKGYVYIDGDDVSISTSSKAHSGVKVSGNAGIYGNGSGIIDSVCCFNGYSYYWTESPWVRHVKYVGSAVSVDCKDLLIKSIKNEYDTDFDAYVANLKLDSYRSYPLDETEPDKVDGVIEIYYGKTKFDPSDYVTSGKKAVNNGDGTWSVVLDSDNYVLFIDSEGYDNIFPIENVENGHLKSGKYYSYDISEFIDSQTQDIATFTYSSKTYYFVADKANVSDGKLIGGTYDFDDCEYFVADGYKMVDNQNGTFSIVVDND